ncbi:MAG: type II toxin-antitoxin system RelE/ParE family toxin [Firmicutes bacterium]|nr:type II toxin-antitoxin system RelE/ParE family toxin [Bacillota bacterium]
MKYKIVTQDEAKQDVLGIRTKISYHSLQGAENVIIHIVESTRNLALFPKMGVSLRNKFGVDTDARMLIHTKYPYITIYKVVESEIQILRVLPAKSDYMKTLGF